MNFGRHVTDEDRDAAIKRGSEALARLLLDSYLKQKRGSDAADDDWGSEKNSW